MRLEAVPISCSTLLSRITNPQNPVGRANSQAGRSRIYFEIPLSPTGL